jgi:plasmid maintenance system killer protein
VIKSFKHKGLAELFEKGSSRKIRPDLLARTLRRFEVLDQAESLTDLNIPGFDFHGLQGEPNVIVFMSMGRGTSPLNGWKARAVLIDFE